MNIDELFRGFSNQDEYIARDMMILEVLINKGLITSEDISDEKYFNIAKERIENEDNNYGY